MQRHTLRSIRTYDENGVDLATLAYTLTATEVSIGTAGAAGLSYGRHCDLLPTFIRQPFWRDSLSDDITLLPTSPKTLLGAFHGRRQ
jgi:hypothetical protein